MKAPIKIKVPIKQPIKALMKITLEKTIKPSKLQPQIFALAREFQNKKEEDFRAVVSPDNEVMCFIITPSLFEKYQKLEAMVQFGLERLEDEEDAERLNEILKKTPQLISADEVYKKAGI